MATSYQKLLSTLVKWPVNPKKKARDYGFHLRKIIQQPKESDLFSGPEADIMKKVNSLIRLSNNKYGLKYPSIVKIGASGMEKDDVAVVLSDEFIEYFNTNGGILKALFK